MFNFFPRRTLGAVCVCVALGPVSTPVHAVGDVLDTPAMETQLAASSVLLDAASAGERLVAVGERGHIILSDNRGESWRQAQVPVSVTLTAVTFPTPEKGWAVGHSGAILHSDDAGETWSLQFDGLAGQPLVIESLERRIEEMAERLDEIEDEDERSDLEWDLEDLEFTLEDAEMDAEAGPWQPLLDVWFADGQEGIAVGSYGQMFRTDDGGETWHFHGGAITNPQRFHFNSIHETEDGVLFMAAESGLVFRSMDAGETWDTLETPYHGSFFGVTDTGREGEILAFGLRGNVFRSENLGEDWARIDSGGNRTINSAHRGDDGQLALVANDGAIFSSTDYGDSFHVHTRPSRHSYVGVLILPELGLLLVGERGVLITDHRGQDFLL